VEQFPPFAQSAMLEPDPSEPGSAQFPFLAAPPALRNGLPGYARFGRGSTDAGGIVRNR
jgi:hypothetical protein